MSQTRSEFLKLIGLGTLAAAGSGLPLGARTFMNPEPIQEARTAARKIRIKDIEIYPFGIPLKEPFTIAIGTVTSSNGVLIRILTNAGIIGIGEACPFLPITGETQESCLEVAKALRTILMGKDPLAIDMAQKHFGEFFHSSPSTVAAFDMALYDILGKVAGMPVFRLLGGDKTTFETDWTTSIDTPEVMARNARMRVSKGFKTLKVKLGVGPGVDIERMQAIRDAVGYKCRIRIDANQGYSVPQAVEALRGMEKFQIEFCEQPVVHTDIEGMAYVRKLSPIPIAADESLWSPADAVRLIEAKACDYFNIKLTKAGGITNALKIAWIAEAADIRCMIGCMEESRIGLTAAAHVHAARKNIIFADLDSFMDLAEDPILDGISIKDGMITLPEKPGLGVDIDPAFLRKMRKV